MHMSLKEIVHTKRGIAIVVLEIVSYIAMLPFVFIEYRTIEEYWEDWLNAWNALDVVAYLLQVSRSQKPISQYVCKIVLQAQTGHI